MCSIQKDASALLLPQQEQHMDDVFSATCVGSCGAVVHKCARFGFGCARCAQCARMSLALTAVFSECFASCAHICRMCRTLSQNSTRLGIRLTTRTSCARIRKNSSGKDFSLGSKSEPWRQIRELFRPEGKVATFPGAPGAVRGRIWRFGQIWRPGGYSN